MKHNSYIYRLIVGLFFAGLLLLLLTTKGEVVLLVNGSHTLFLDRFFSIVTNFGDGLIFIPTLLIFLFIRFKYTCLTLAAGLVQTIIITLCKRVIFDDAPRPRNFIDPDLLHFIPWVDVHGWMSFPSGHTASIFGLALLLALIVKRKGITTFLIVMAVIVGCSRIYLLQHFYIDVFAGMIVGLWSTYIAWYLFHRYTLPAWMDGKLAINVKITTRKSKEVQQAGT